MFRSFQAQDFDFYKIQYVGDAICRSIDLLHKVQIPIPVLQSKFHKNQYMRFKVIRENE